MASLPLKLRLTHSCPSSEPKFLGESRFSIALSSKALLTAFRISFILMRG